mgnify:CR=1 FL=1
MSSKPIHWNEGLFLRPHHFQAADRHDWAQRALGASLALGRSAGIGEIDIDLDALGNHTFQVRVLKAVLPDGTLVSIPGESGVKARNFKAELDRDGAVSVSLGLPLMSLGRANNLPPGEGSDQARCLVEPLSVDDENDGQRNEEILVRGLNLRLLFQGEKTDGLAVLPLARVVRSNRPDGAPALDPDFYPPVFRCGAYGPLLENILRYLLNRVGRKATGLVTQLRAGGMSLGAREPLLMAQLNALNAAQGALHALANDATAPLGAAYSELCRLAGSLAFAFAAGSAVRAQDADPYLAKVREAVSREAQTYASSYREGAGEGVRYTAFDRYEKIAEQSLARMQSAQQDLARGAPRRQHRWWQGRQPKVYGHSTIIRCPRPVTAV